MCVCRGGGGEGGLIKNDCADRRKFFNNTTLGFPMGCAY